MNSTAIPSRIFFYRIPLARRMKNRIPHGWILPQYRTLKSKLPKYRLKKAQYRNTVNPHVPLHLIRDKYTSIIAPATTSQTSKNMLLDWV